MIEEKRELVTLLTTLRINGNQLTVVNKVKGNRSLPLDSWCVEKKWVGMLGVCWKKERIISTNVLRSWVSTWHIQAPIRLDMENLHTQSVRGVSSNSEVTRRWERKSLNREWRRRNDEASLSRDQSEGFILPSYFSLSLDGRITNQLCERGGEQKDQWWLNGKYAIGREREREWKRHDFCITVKWERNGHHALQSFSLLLFVFS